MQPMTMEEFRASLPDKMKKTVNQDLLDQINATLTDPDLYESYRDNLLSYTKVMQDGKFQIHQYLAAVKYVSFKLMGHSNIESFSRTFPEKIQRYAQNGTDAKTIASYVSIYNGSKLVNLVYEQALIPSHILNRDLYQKALNVQADLMMTANSEKVRTDAANSLLTHLKPPEVKKVELAITEKEDSSISQLRQATLELAAQQKLLLQSGAANAQEIAHSQVLKKEAIDVEVKEVR